MGTVLVSLNDVSGQVEITPLSARFAMSLPDLALAGSSERPDYGERR
jgi:hypothetical protein